MDALKSAGRALIRSPSLAKQSWGGGGRHRSECVRVRRGRAGAGGLAACTGLLWTPGRGEAGPDPSPEVQSGPSWPRGVRGRPGSSVPPPHLIPALRSWGGGTGAEVGDWSSGSRGQAAVGEGLQVRGRDLHDPRHLPTSPPWTARGGRSSASVPGGGGVGAGAGEYAPIPAALRPSRDVSGWRAPTCPFPPPPPPRTIHEVIF